MTPDLAWWEHLAAFLLAQTALLVGAAAVAHCIIRAAQARRAVWQAALVAMGCLWVGEVAGLGEKARALWPHEFGETVRSADFRVTTTAVATGITLTDHPLPVAPVSPAPAVRWPAAIWLSGTLLLLLRAAAVRGWLAWQRQGMELAEAGTQEAVTRLQAALGLCRVEARIWPRLRGPVAFGAWRPTVALPRDFCQRFSAAQQEAMLAHELAHLAARDPFFLALADMVCAVAWWNPLVWLATNQLRAACETAADEASALVASGPSALAESLLLFGRELAESGPARGLGVAGNGFRSGLGRRVKILLTNSVRWRELPAFWRWSPRILAVILVAALTELPVLTEPSGSLAGIMAASARAETIGQGEFTKTDTPAAVADGHAAPIHKILIRYIGPATVKESLIRSNIVSAEGKPFSRNQASRDMKNIFATGFFHQIHLDLTNLPQGVDITFVVQPSPVVTAIQIVGNKKLDSDTLQRTISCKIGERLDPVKLFQDTKTIDELYQKAGCQESAALHSPVIDEKAGTASVTIEVREQPSSPPGMLDENRAWPQPSPISAPVAQTATVSNQIPAIQVGDFMNSNSPPVTFPADTDLKMDIQYVLAEGPASETVHLQIKIASIREGSPAQIAADKLFRNLPPDQSGGPDAVARFLADAHIKHTENARVDYRLTTEQSATLPAPQFKAILDSFQKQNDCDILSAPVVTQLLGQQSQVAVEDIQQIVTAIVAGTVPGSGGATNTLATDQLHTGFTAKLLPTKSAGGWDLSVTARETTFVGYDNSGPPAKGMPVLPLPHIGVDEIAGHGTLHPGETLILRGPAGTETNQIKDSVLGVFHRTRTEVLQKRLYLFVTPVTSPK